MRLTNANNFSLTFFLPHIVMKGMIRLLKNNTERKEFLMNDDNWKIIHDLPDIATKISQLELPDGTKILKYNIREERAGETYFIGVYVTIVHDITRYRVVLNDHVSDEVSMTYLIDLLKKVKA